MNPPVCTPRLTRRLAPTLFCLLLFGIIVAMPAAAVPQEPNPSPESVADAARESRERKANTDATRSAKVLTNDDLAAAVPEQVTPVAQGAAAAGAEAEEPQKTICPNPDEERIKRELQAAQEELDQLRSELSADAPIISGNNLDLSNFKPGSSGVTFGSPPLLDSAPPAPGRVREVELKEKVAALKEAARIACESSGAAKIQEQLNPAEGQLKLLLRQFSLDQDTYYSKPDYASDSAGKAKLDDEQQQIEELQAEVDRLREKLASERQEPAPE